MSSFCEGDSSVIKCVGKRERKQASEGEKERLKLSENAVQTQHREKERKRVVQKFDQKVVEREEGEGEDKQTLT